MATVVFFVVQRKEFFAQEAKRSLESALSGGSDLEVRIGKISGYLLGRVRFQDVKVLSPGDLPEDKRLVFRVKEISFRYRFLDFLSKKFNSRISIVVQSPEIFWRQHLRLSHRLDFPFLGWMREWALAQKDLIDVSIFNLNLAFEAQEFKLEGVNLTYANNRVKAEIPLRHVTVGVMDISTVINATGDFRLGFFGAEDRVEGEMHTEGSVVNWSPLPKESRFDFSFSRSAFHLTSSDFLGGIEIRGGVDFEKDYQVFWEIDTLNYPLSNLDFILKATPKSLLPSRVDVDLRFEGSPAAPLVEGRARIYEGFIGKKTFKAMDLQVSGVYPTVHLENSRLLLNDDSVMKFADKTLEFRELFHEKTYEGLIGDMQQDTVVWGDWEFRRPRDMNDKPEFLLQRSFGERARLNFHEYERDQTLQNTDSKKLEVGVEYNLPGKNSLKFELREDERFVGVERKVKF